MPATAAHAVSETDSGAVPTVTSDPVAEQSAAESRALARAVAADAPVEVPELTSETTRVMANPAGSFTAEVAPSPVRVMQNDTWVPTDTTLVKNADGSIRPKAAAVDLSLSGGGEAKFADLSDAGMSLELSWKSTLPEPVLSEDTATYPEVMPGVDLVVRAGVESFSTYVVVKNAEAAQNPDVARLTFGMKTAGLSMSTDAAGGIQARDSLGVRVFEAAEPRMWDSKTQTPPEGTPVVRSLTGGVLFDPAEGFAPKRAPVELTANSLTVKSDTSLLTAADTVFPVVIDPSFVRSKNSFRTVWSNGIELSDPSEKARVGFDGWSDNKKARSFYRFDISDLEDKHIFRATFRHHLVHSPNWDCDATSSGPGVRLYRSAPFSSKTTWNNLPAIRQELGVNTKVHGHEKVCAGSTTLEWNIEGAVEKTDGNLYLGMRSADESDKWGWRKFGNASGYPKIEVEYNTPPSAPSHLSLKNPDLSCSTDKAAPRLMGGGKGGLASTPTINAVLSDPDGGGTLKARFEVYKNDALVSSFVEGPWQLGSKGTSRTLTGLADGAVYGYRVRAEETYKDASGGTEGTDVSPWTRTCYFKTDFTKPVAPKVASEGGKYPCFGATTTSTGVATGCDDKLHGGVGDPGWFTLTSSTDVQSIKYRVNDNPTWKTMSPSASTPNMIRIQVTPNEYGLNTLHTRAVDKANNESAEGEYEFGVAAGKAAVAHWKLDETSGTAAADSTSGTTKHPLTVQLAGGSAHSGWTANGRLGRAARFDGAADHAVSSGPVVADTRKSFSVAAWVRMDTATAATNILAQTGVNANAFNLYYSSAEENFKLGLMPTDVSGSTGVVTLSAPGDRTVGVWTHIAAVVDRSDNQARLYVDGRKVASTAFTGGFQATGGFHIAEGVTTTGTIGNRFDGTVDDVRIWDRVIAGGELEEQVHGLAPSATGESVLPGPELVGAWDFDHTVTDANNKLWVVDSSGYSRSVELGADAQLLRDPLDTPKRGTVLWVNGESESFARTTAPIVDGAGSYVLSAWVRPEDETQPAPVLTQGSAGATGPAKNTTWLGISRTGVASWIYDQYSEAGGDKTTVTSPDLPEQGWTHLTVVYDHMRGELRLYVNGAWKQTMEGATGMHWQTAVVRMGAEVPGSTQLAGLIGQIDNVKIFTGVMTDNQVKSLYRGI